MSYEIKDWLGSELARNKVNAALYTELMQRAVGNITGCKNISVLIGHHLTFELDAVIETENEIPSADCLMFDHTLMTAVFGYRAVPLMQNLAALPCNERDVLLRQALESI